MNKWSLLDKFIAEIRYIEIMKNVIFQNSNMVVCDIGCGMEGQFLLSLKDKISYGYGFDMKTENRSIDNISLKLVDDLHNGIPLPDDSVDYAFLIAVLEHLSEPQIILREISRILKQGGKLVLTTPTPSAKPLLELMAFRLHVISEDEILDHKHYYTEAEIRNICSMCGLDIGQSYHKFWFGMNSIACGEKKGS